jgi:solute:Na+ symporter, SSS family
MFQIHKLIFFAVRYMNNYTFNNFVSFLLVLLFCGMAGAYTPDTESFFEFAEIGPLGIELEDAFVGRQGDNILVLGGFEMKDSGPSANNSVFVLSADASEWKESAQLQRHISGGAAISTDEGVICIGGFKDGRPSNEVVRYSIENGNIRAEQMPDLPAPMPEVKAAQVLGMIYAIDSDAAFTLDLLAVDAKWEKSDRWQPTGAKVLSAAGILENLFVFTQDNGFKVHQLTGTNTFDKFGDVDFDISNSFASPCGLAHIVFVSKSGENNDILAYHTITDKWVVLGSLPQQIKPVGMVFNDTRFSVIGSNASVSVNAVLPSTKYGWFDHGVVVIFMVCMLYVGAYLAKRERNSEDYFRGGKRVPWWASGLSLFATGASAISLMAMPGKAYATDWFYMGAGFFTIITVLPISMYIYMPIARRLEVSTANEYLERRYNVYLRMAGSIIWSLLQILGRMSAIMLLPAIAISSVTGIAIEVSIVIMGIVTTCYVFLGGLEGVIWTDVLQAVVMICAVVVCAVWALMSLDTGYDRAFEVIQNGQKLHMFDGKMTLVEPCAMILFLNILVSTLGGIGDQNFIQRIQCTPSEKEAKKAILTQVAVAVPLNAVLFGLGTILFLFYREKPEMLSPAMKSDGIFPLFAAQNLPAGLAGLVIAAILAATMSTLSSALNSVANVGVEDFYRRFSKNATDRKCLVLGRFLTAGLGVFGTVAALLLARTNLSSIWDLFMVIFGLLLGTITGIYTLGIFTRRANSIGAVTGIITSIAATLYVMKGTHMHFLTYPVVGVVVCYAAGYITSIIIPVKQKDITGLTVYTFKNRIVRN